MLRRERARDEPLAGTASTVRSWLLLEHPGPWGRDAFADARHETDGLGGEIARRCRRARVRPLLIRRVGREIAPVRPTCFVVRSDPRPPGSSGRRWTARRRVVDRSDGARARRAARVGPHDDALFLVCTHGRHDVCCAERGRPLARGARLASCPSRRGRQPHRRRPVRRQRRRDAARRVLRARRARTGRGRRTRLPRRAGFAPPPPGTLDAADAGAVRGARAPRRLGLERIDDSR